ncbi:hypothetical protein RFI_00610 [Reticulomyxa filosa]|uniref:Uncharacterized protein n=1 Tax=Reticulomyxa filosa TaxID=46433 RepID=X6PEC9_RETFI|nr:hypothetical protein RFI_00610 [Reticulomyxa filosa]|eukprot:ETO36453.1 hypothetical protein RFI_00610 [Reticulomyxa filosa]
MLQYIQKFLNVNNMERGLKTLQQFHEEMVDIVTTNGIHCVQELLLRLNELLGYSAWLERIQTLGLNVCFFFYLFILFHFILFHFISHNCNDRKSQRIIFEIGHFTYPGMSLLCVCLIWCVQTCDDTMMCIWEPKMQESKQNLEAFATYLIFLAGQYSLVIVLILRNAEESSNVAINFDQLNVHRIHAAIDLDLKPVLSTNQ